MAWPTVILPNIIFCSFGAMKTSKEMRFIHKWGGRLATAAGWASCVLGFMKLDSDPMHQVAFAAPLAFAALFVLL